jgi:hypothetical protein
MDIPVFGSIENKTQFKEALLSGKSDFSKDKG